MKREEKKPPQGTGTSKEKNNAIFFSGGIWETGHMRSTKNQHRSDKEASNTRIGKKGADSFMQHFPFESPLLRVCLCILHRSTPFMAC